MQNNEPIAASSAAASDGDPRLQAIAGALRAAGALPDAGRDALLARIRRHLGGLDGHEPTRAFAESFTAPQLEQLELGCLARLVDAGLLDAATLAAVHTVFAEARAEAQPEVQQALAARDRQLSIATHELRTPISSILLNLQMLERHATLKGALDAATVQRMLGVPSRQLRRLTRMVDLLLDTAQVEAGRLLLHPQEVDLCELVHEAAARLESLARESGARISLGDCVSVVGRWDRLRLEQVVTNLLTNAIKYGGGAVDVRTSGGMEAMLVVRDHGAGIAAEDQERIFEPFERVQSTSGEDGAGLGLYIVREIVRAHGGRIEVGSAPGQGATFTVFLPL